MSDEQESESNKEPPIYPPDSAMGAESGVTDEVIGLNVSRTIIEKLIDAMVHEPGEFFTPDERDELLIALTRALEGEVSNDRTT